MSSVTGRQHATVQVQPVIAEILRTCVYPATVNLRIEQIKNEHVQYNRPSDEDDRHGRVIKLVLTDGQLLIHALLHRTLSALPELQDLSVGDIVEIHQFVVKKAKRHNGQGHVVYLGIDNCYVIKGAGMGPRNAAINADTQVVAQARPEQQEGTVNNEGRGRATAGTHLSHEDIPAISTVPRPEVHLQGTDFDLHKKGGQSPCEIEADLNPRQHGSREAKLRDTSNTTINKKPLPEPIRSPAMSKRKSAVLFESDSENEDAFETVRVDPHTVKKRRQALHELSQNVVVSTSMPTTHRSPPATPDKHCGHMSDTSRPSTVRFEIQEPHQPAHLRTSTTRLKLPESSLEAPITAVHDWLPNEEQKSQLVDHNSPSSRTHDVHAPVKSTEPALTGPSTFNSSCDAHGPFHDLMRLYSSSLPSKSYVFSALVVPTFVSAHLISRPNTPFPPKRHIKVIDPSAFSKFMGSRPTSLNKGITVSVYRDAVHFKPTVGKVALLRGVVMQRISGVMKNGHGSTVGEVILNVYPVKSRIQRQSQSQSQWQQSQQRTLQNSKTTLSREQEDDQSRVNEASSAATRHAVGGLNSSEAQVNRPKSQAPAANGEAQTEAVSEDSWFVDDHDLLRQHGYDVDGMQRWWDGLTGGK